MVSTNDIGGDTLSNALFLCHQIEENVTVKLKKASTDVDSARCHVVFRSQKLLLVTGGNRSFHLSFCAKATISESDPDQKHLDPRKMVK
jgi:hypothetical protein